MTDRRAITGKTAVFALLGSPVRHSRSPAIHNALIAHVGLDAVYVCLDVRSGPLRPILAGLAGANLTVPLKVEALGALDALTPVAQAIGAVNTVYREGERLVGDNTDALGFVRGLEEAWGPLEAEHAVVLGAGGAARAVVAGLAERGVPHITVVNRTEARAQALIADLGDRWPTALEARPFDASALEGADLVVNSTSGPARPLVERLSVEGLASQAIWCDLNYWDPDPPHFAECKARGLRVLDGLPMLVHQALLAFARFTGQTPPAEVAWEAVRAAYA